MRSVQVGICGLGTVGSGVFNVISRNSSNINDRANCTINIAQIGARRDNPNCDTASTNVVRDIFEVAQNLSLIHI